MNPGPFPALHPAVQVHASAGHIDPLWDRFEVFEAIHHSQRICNPMNEAELIEMLAWLAPAERSSWLDVACGSGEVVIRAMEHGTSAATGLDLSPWMLNAACAETAERLEDRRHPDWVLANASAWVPAEPADCVTCLGADWIWHGMHGTIPKLKERVRAGGVVAYGGPRLNFGADPAAVTQDFGKLETAGEVEARLGECGFRVLTRIDPGEQGWVDYLERGRRDVEQWAQRHPGERAERWRAEQQDWTDHFERDRALVGWSVWVAESIGAAA